MKRRPSHWRVYEAFSALVRFVYRYPAVLAIVPLAVFFPLLDSRGLYEYGDANFPLNPFWVDYILPWSGAASAGADNTFIGVPRLVYHLGIDALIATFHNWQMAQWIWYSSMSALGLFGAFALARRLGAGIYSIPLAIFYAFNLWSYDRIAQGPIYLSYQAMPLVIYLLLRYLARPSVAAALYFACSLLFVIPALQISYLAALICLGIAVREVVLRGWRVIGKLALLAVAVVAANAFYVFSMLADLWLNAGGNIALVNQRFDVGIFLHYAENVSVFNTLRLTSFYYTSLERQLPVVQFAVVLIPLLLLSLLLLARKPTVRSKFYGGVALALLGIWLVDGIVIAPAFYQWFRNAIPGLRSFVEPDYYSPLYVAGAFVMLASALRLGARAYGLWWKIGVWIAALTGVLAFLPINGPESGMPQTGQPRQYAEFSRSKVRGSTLWIPPERGVEYRWSPYVINGFTSLNSPSDAIGPTMAEWVAPGTARVQARLANGFMAGQLNTVETLAPLLGVGTVAIAADSLGQLGEWPNPEITGALQTLSALQDRGFLSLRGDYRDERVRLVTATIASTLPELGVYDAPVDVGGFDNYMWLLALSKTGTAPYTPVAADAPPGASYGGRPMRFVAVPAPHLRYVPIEAFAGASCSLPAKRHRTPYGPAPRSLRTEMLPRCFVLPLSRIREIAALTINVDGRLPELAPPGDELQPQLIFDGNGSDADWIDPRLAAQEVPARARSAAIRIDVPPYTLAVLRGVTIRWAARGQTAAIPPVPTCATSQVRWSEQNPLVYTLRGNVNGRCTLVFRQSFAPIWTLFASGGSAKVLGHLQIDGFANGWIVDASGPVTFRIVNRAIFAYAAGMILTLASVLLALGFALHARLTRAEPRESRVPSPA